MSFELCFLPVLLSPVPRQHTLHIRSAHGVRGMDLHGVKGLPLHQPVQQFDGIAALICKISQVMVEIQHLDLDAVSLRLPDQCLGFTDLALSYPQGAGRRSSNQIFIISRSFSLIQAFQICFDHKCTKIRKCINIICISNIKISKFYSMFDIAVILIFYQCCQRL